VVSENEKINNIGSKSDWWGGFINFGKKNYFPNSQEQPGHSNILRVEKIIPGSSRSYFSRLQGK
jgi:hypothetical protein